MKVQSRSRDQCENRGIKEAVCNHRIQSILGKHPLEDCAGSWSIVQPGRKTHDGTRCRIPCYPQSRLPLAEIIRNEVRLRNCCIGMDRLRVPLPVPSQAGSKREVGAQRELAAYVNAWLSNSAAINSIAGSKGLAVASWDISEEIRQGVEIEASVEIGLVKFARRIIGKGRA